MLSSSARRALNSRSATIKSLASQPIDSLSTAAHAVSSREETVTVLRLNNLYDNPGAVKKKRRVGRGIGSSKGKTCGKGHKGQSARNKSSIPTGFEGGQTKFWKTIPKRGFSNQRHRQKQGADMAIVNLGTIQDYIDMGRLKIEDDATLDVTDFMAAGILKKKSSLPGVKLLCKGKERFRSPVRLVVNRASESAIAHTEDIGGEVTTTHLNRLAMKALISPEKFPKLASIDEEDDEDQYLLPKQARPPPKMQAYYTSWKNRGYLCPQVQMRAWLQARPEYKETFAKALGTIEEKESEEP